MTDNQSTLKIRSAIKHIPSPCLKAPHLNEHPKKASRLKIWIYQQQKNYAAKKCRYKWKTVCGLVVMNKLLIWICSVRWPPSCIFPMKICNDCMGFSWLNNFHFHEKQLFAFSMGDILRYRRCTMSQLHWCPAFLSMYFLQTLLMCRKCYSVLFSISRISLIESDN